MVNADSSPRPPSLQRDKRPILAKLLFPVVPESDATAPLPSPNQLVPSKTRVSKNTRRIVNVSDLTRLCLCRRIQKIYDMSTDVIEGYGTYYYDKYGKPLPQGTVDKIMLSYHNRIQRRCNEVGLSVEEEEQWDPSETNVNVDTLSNSGKESEEHESDDVNFYSNEDDDSDEDDDKDNDDDGEFDGDKSNGKEINGDDDSKAIAKLEQEIKTLHANLAEDLIILKRMTNSPNRKNPYAKFDEWSAWKKNDVAQKVAAIKWNIHNLKAKENAKDKGNHR
jgi:hypothetical protein